MKVSVLMPAYNKEKTVFESIKKMKGVLNDLNLDHEIIVVNDGSMDHTLDEMRRAKEINNDIRLVHYDINEGKGNALKYGFKFSDGNLIYFQDADTDLNPDKLKVFLRYMEENNSDIVIGSKRHPKSNLIYPFKRKLLSKGYQMLVKIFFDLNVTDTQVGSKLFKREVLEEVFPRVLVKRWAFDLELLVNAHNLGYKITEAPVDLNFAHFDSVIDRRVLGCIKNMFIDTCAIFYRDKILNYYDRVN
ncbi:MAG: glycosyltransferase [Candidatus Aenigmarchaeota archaeon]|nr:glycosyltransferase [Candidatus Aenigmarchaeota archaeon]